MRRLILFLTLCLPLLAGAQDSSEPFLRMELDKGTAAPGETVVLQSDGTKVAVATDDIDETVDARTSAMPANLLDTLTLEEVAQLFAYLTNPPAPGVTRRNEATDGRE